VTEHPDGTVAKARQELGIHYTGQIVYNVRRYQLIQCEIHIFLQMAMSFCSVWRRIGFHFTHHNEDALLLFIKGKLSNKYNDDCSSWFPRVQFKAIRRNGRFTE